MKNMKKLFARRRNYSELDDPVLAELAKSDKEAFGELYERHMLKIYNYVYYRTSSRHDAEDLTARVFFRALEHIGSYVDKGVPFQAWLYRIAHNLTANWHRDQGRRKIIPLDEVIAHSLKSEAPERLAEEGDERAGLMRAVRRLPAERQQLLHLKFIERQSNAKIGEMLGRSEGAVKSLYHRTLRALRDELQMQEHSRKRRPNSSKSNPASDSNRKKGQAE